VQWVRVQLKRDLGDFPRCQLLPLHYPALHCCFILFVYHFSCPLQLVLNWANVGHTCTLVFSFLGEPPRKIRNRGLNRPVNWRFRADRYRVEMQFENGSIYSHWVLRVREYSLPWCLRWARINFWLREDHYTTFNFEAATNSIRNGEHDINARTGGTGTDLRCNMRISIYSDRDTTRHSRATP